MSRPTLEQSGLSEARRSTFLWCMEFGAYPPKGAPEISARQRYGPEGRENALSDSFAAETGNFPVWWEREGRFLVKVC